MKCATHPENDATATCVNCGKAVCAECGTSIAKRNYCATCADEYDGIKSAAQPQIVVNTSASASAAATAAAPAMPMAIKSPGLAALLSFLFVGAGQFYNGQVVKGLVFIVATVVLWFVMLGWLVHLVAIFDAYNTAKNINIRGYI